MRRPTRKAPSRRKEPSRFRRPSATTVSRSARNWISRANPTPAATVAAANRGRPPTVVIRRELGLNPAHRSTNAGLAVAVSDNEPSYRALASCYTRNTSRRASDDDLVCMQSGNKLRNWQWLMAQVISQYANEIGYIKREVFQFCYLFAVSRITSCWSEHFQWQLSPLISGMHCPTMSFQHLPSSAYSVIRNLSFSQIILLLAL